MNEKIDNVSSDFNSVNVIRHHDLNAAVRIQVMFIYCPNNRATCLGGDLCILIVIVLPNLDSSGPVGVLAGKQVQHVIPMSGLFHNKL
jgi:hypothetical protein